MKICHFISYSVDAHYLINLGKGLAQKDVKLLCGTLFESGKETPKWISENPQIEYFCLGAKSKKDFPSAIWQLSKKLRQEKVDVLQTHLYEASFVGLLAAKLTKIPLRILTRHYLDQAHQIGNKIALRLDVWEAKDADKIVVLSNAVKEFMTLKEGADPEKIQVIHQGFDFEHFTATAEERQNIRNEFGFQETDFVIGTIANFFPTKGHRFLVEAVKVLENEIPQIKLFFVGNGGEREVLESKIQKAGLSERVVFSGFRKDVPACMSAMDMVIHPSLSEAFCQVLIESMSVGKPLISTDVGGAKEVVTDGKTGLLIPPEDVTAIVEAIRKLYFDKDFRENMALEGKKSVRQTFTIEKMVEKQFECYQTWLAEKKK